MPRANLARLLDDLPSAPPQETAPSRSTHQKTQGGIASTPPSAPRAGQRHLQPTPASEPDAGPLQADQQPAGTEDGEASPPTPRYLQMERKELRIRLDQADELARLTRRLNRARAKAGERITDNTLIRVAIDLLLQHSDRLTGRTEDELRGSLTL